MSSSQGHVENHGQLIVLVSRSWKGINSLVFSLLLFRIFVLPSQDVDMCLLPHITAY